MNYRMDSTSSAKGVTAITKSDSAFLSTPVRGIYVGTSGDVCVMALSGEVVTFKNLAAGMIHPIAAQKIFSTGTTATDIVGIY